METSANMPTRCEFCGRPLQTKTMTFAGVQRRLLVPCDCEGAQKEAARYDAEQEEQKRQREAERRERKLAATGIPPRYWTEQTDRDDLVATAKDRGLWLEGGVGVGKTALACAIGIRLFDEGLNVMFVKAADLIDMLSSFADNLEATKHIQAPDLLIIDDIGMDETKDWKDRRFRRAIDARWDSGKPIIATSNFTKQELARIYSQNDPTNADAIMSRLFAMTEKVRLEGPDWRVKR